MSLKSSIVPRFSSKASAYELFRWPFERQAIAALLEQTGLSSGAVVVDIGSGTGMSSSPFLEAGCEVYGIEPNAAMRREAERVLEGEVRFHSMNGFAENTGMADDSVDLIVVGRAIHWFAQAETRSEFARISRQAGWLAIMGVSCEDEALLAAVKSSFRAEYGWDVQASKSNRKVEPLAYFFDEFSYRELRSRQVVRETWPQFLGRLVSLSTAPNTDHDYYIRFERKLREIFDLYQQQGELIIPVVTKIAFGHPFGKKS